MGAQRDFLLLCSCAYLIVSLVLVAGNRKLISHVFTCPPSKCSESSSIIHVKAVAEDNSSTIHHLWTTYPVPTMVVAYTTKKDVDVSVDWGMLSNASAPSSGVKFSSEVNYTVGFALPLFYEYADKKDKVDLNDNSHVLVHYFTKNTRWVMDWDNSTSQVKFTANKSVILKFVASYSEDRESYLPYEKYTANSTRFSFTLNKFHVSTNHTRFAVEFNYIVKHGHVPRVTTEKSIDDEYSPAVFETVYGKVQSMHDRAYSQWKPVAYTKQELGRKYQTRASAGKVNEVQNRSWNIAEILMGEKYQIYGVNVSFGLNKDGFYQKNQFLTWTGLVGYGDPAKSSLSLFVILIISIGLGLPLAIIIFGGTYVQIRKRCGKKSDLTTYGRIN